MLKIIKLSDPAMFKSDMDEFIKIFPEMVNYFNKKENYYVYMNTLEVDIQIEQFDEITDIYNCQFTDDSLIIFNSEF